ncbi:hypothetical protein KJ966_01980 [bacterium]|nr:hypothetical protein [bacterium]
MPLIFLTNDDGVHSPGLLALASAIQPFADIEIIAPSHQMTASGRGLFGDRSAPLETTTLDINNRKVTAYHAPCSPAQVVMLGIQVLGAKRKPDLLISGINYGENVGRDISMSGTIGAAIQAKCMNVPAMAVSMQVPVDYHFTYGEVDWSVTGYFAQKFARMLLNRPLPEDVDLLKLDVPQNSTRDTKWRVTRVAHQSNFEAQIKNPSLSSRLSDADIKVGMDFETLDKDSDIHAIQVDKVVSITPLSLNYTSRIELLKLQEFINDVDEL